MLPDRVSNPGPLTYESGALPIALRGPAKRGGNPLSYSPPLHLMLLTSCLPHSMPPPPYSSVLGPALNSTVFILTFLELECFPEIHFHYRKIK